jgi:hypothetical protein
MHKSHIELWRVGNVTCQWMADWRRIRIVSAGEILSDQMLATPSEALASARELRLFFKSISSRADARRAKPASSESGARN